MFEARISRIYSGANIHGSKATLVVQIISSPSARTDQHREGSIYTELIQNVIDLQPSHTKAWAGDLPSLTNPTGNIDLAECIGYLTVILQRWIGYPVSEYSCLPALPDLDQNTSLICIEYNQIKPAIAALKAIVSLISDLEQYPDRVRRISDSQDFRGFMDKYVGKPPTQFQFIREAQKRNIPWRNLGETYQYLELGHGRKRQRVHRQFSMKTTYIAAQISTDKSITNHLLRSRGLPVPQQFVVANEQQAMDAFRKLGAPVVVKPLATDYGIAVHPGLTSMVEVVEAFHVAKRHGNVLVESHIAGDHHRIMIINGKLTSARKQLPAHVTGNGSDNIRQLVDEANRLRQKNGWAPIPTDAESQAQLKRQHLHWESIPAQHQRANLRLQGNLSTGGTMEIVTDIIHQDNVFMAKRAAAIMDIDIAGIDFITTDISKPYHESGGQICEINVSPGFIFNEAKLILDDWFPNQDNGRIPVMVFLDIPRNSHLNDCLTDTVKVGFHSAICIVNEHGAFLNDHRLCDKSLSMNKRIQLALAEPDAIAVAIFLDSIEIVADGVCLEQIDFMFTSDAEESMGDENYTQKIEALSVLTKLSQPPHQYAFGKLSDAITEEGLKLHSLEGAADEAAECIVCKQISTNKENDLLRRVSMFMSLFQA